LIALFLPIFSLYAEDNKNYANCDICHGGIHYGPEEAKEILGKECFDLIALLRDQLKTVKIDLDGDLKNGSRETPDTGYEIKAWGADPFYIEDLRDGSIILISSQTADLGQASTFGSWWPEIYLYASESDEIDLKDSMDVAWEKMKSSAIYFWVMSENENMEWNGLLKARMLKVLKLITGE
jgi:hypothetical protein